MGSLKLYKTIYANGQYELLWNITGNQGNNWNRNFIEIKSTSPFKVIEITTLKSNKLNDYNFSSFLKRLLVTVHDLT